MQLTASDSNPSSFCNGVDWLYNDLGPNLEPAQANVHMFYKPVLVQCFCDATSTVSWDNMPWILYSTWILLYTTLDTNSSYIIILFIYIDNYLKGSWFMV